MNIGIVCYPTFGGSGVVATELGKALAKQGHKVHFISYQQPARLDVFNENLFYHEVMISMYPLFDFPPYETALTSKLVDVVQFEKLDLLHVHYAIPHASAAILAKHILRQKGVNIPVITTLHGTDITLVGKDKTFEPVVTYSINESDIVTTVSESLKKDTYQYFDIQNSIEVVHNFIDFERFNKMKKDHFRKAIAPLNEHIIAHTSNFRKVKRVEDVMHIFCKILETTPSKLLMIGDGPERAPAEQLCRELGTCDHVRFLGKQEAIEEILSVCDLFLLTSENESFGLAALEAMACEVPVISTNAGGIPEVNIDGVTGFLSEVGDVASMSANALKLLNDKALLKQFKSNALNQAKRFDIKNILPQYLALYEKALAMQQK
ncbi:MAG: N-acetyl-alpha-D-glucosaminyl L-malate synthase BshA [Bacteroidetes bacterium]|nr:N-acetyl-alpha-D-glucosaminyl L-malate synthase BshA [Bacteroidota bacterium]